VYFILFFLISLTFAMALFFKKRQQLTACEQGLCAMLLCAQEDDSDIKIVGAVKIDEHDEALDNADELEHHRNSGNLEKARKLGVELSSKIIDEDGDPAFGQDISENDEIRRQRRILLAFTINYAVENNIKSKILDKVVIREFCDSLQKNVPGFYQDLRESGSFSFYYLCIRRGGSSTERCVGNNFAMLAGYEGDPIMEELGESLFFHFNYIIEKTISDIGFAD